MKSDDSKSWYNKRVRFLTPTLEGRGVLKEYKHKKYSDREDQNL